jgi:hypothetical protein
MGLDGTEGDVKIKLNNPLIPDYLYGTIAAMVVIHAPFSKT